MCGRLLSRWGMGSTLITVVICPLFAGVSSSLVVICSHLYHDPDNHDGVITDLEPDILECEVKWALESITTNKASGGDGIPVELFQILKDGTKVLGAGVRHSAHGKGHEEGGLTYAKAGSSLRSPPGNPRASTPIIRACLLYYFVLSPTPLALRGAVPHHLFRRRS